MNILKFIAISILYSIGFTLVLLILSLILNLFTAFLFWDIKPMLNMYNDIFSMKYLIIYRILLILSLLFGIACKAKET